MPAPQFYPSLNKLISSENVPEPIKSGIDSLFSKLFYKSYYVEKSVYGDTAYHHLVLVFNKVGFNLFGGEDGMEIIFNPGEVADTTEISISLYYNLPIVKYVRKIKLEYLSSVEDYFDLILEMFNISKDDILFEAIGAFLGENENPIQSFIDDFNNNPEFSSYTPLVLDDPSEDFDSEYSVVQSLLQQFEHNKLDVKVYLLQNYISTVNIEEGIQNLSNLFKRWMGEFSFETILNLFIPKFSVSVDVLELALAFPRKWLVPVNATTYEVIKDVTQKATLTYKVGNMTYNSETGFEFNDARCFKLSPCQIGNTGIIIEVTDLTLDFKSDKNIPQANADGRPLTFKGIYADEVAIILPKRWFKKENGATLKISGKQMLIGTEGGISGTIVLEPMLKVSEIGVSEYMWFKIGGDNGFKIGFNKFDITFKQNKVIASDIKAALEIKKFVYPDKAKYPNGSDIPPGTIVKINIEGHLHDDGDFNLTASSDILYPIELPGVFTYNLRSVELGKEENGANDLYYIGTSGAIQFEGFLKSTMNLGPIEIERLRIYSDGAIELEGGSINLIKPVVLKLGPVDITVSAIHYGSHQKEYDGQMRNFNYFGFDGGLSVDPLGVEIRGDGVKYYYCSDNLPNPPKAYLHIQTIYLDLTLPADSGSVASINGWLSIPDPGVSPEYAGGVTIKIPKANLTGKADIKLMPKYPAFIIDCEIEPSQPIPLGSFAIYSFRGLFGYRYVAEKEAIGMVSGVDTWYDYYKAPKRGINVPKFNGPNQSVHSSTPISIAAGASLGTLADNGTAFNIKAMVLLSIPSLFMIDGRAAVLSARLGLDNTVEPPFFAFIAVGDNSLELGFGADFKMPTTNGSILSIYGDVQAGFFFKNQKPWYINVGTDVNPISARILTLITLKSYVMLSAKGIKAGARGEFDFQRRYGIIRVHAWAYIEVGGKISFERPQFGAYLKAGVGADIDIKFLSFYLAVDIMFGVEASRPFKIYGKFYYSVRIRIMWVFKFNFSGELEVVWEFNSDVDRKAINPMINEANVNYTKNSVEGVNMLSNEKFELAYLLVEPSLKEPPTPEILDKIIPLDTYIDIKTEKGLLPGKNNPLDEVSKLLGGINNPPERYTDLVPPDAMVNNQPMRQVKHQYSLEKIEIKFWADTAIQGQESQWKDYHPYEAMYPVDPMNPDDVSVRDLKIGQFQKTDGQYNRIRLLATTPFSYTEQGQPGWYVPEQYGITAGTLFCEGKQIKKKCADFELKPVLHKYYCSNPNYALYSNQVAFQLLDEEKTGYAEITNEPNVFNFSQSLQFDNINQMQLLLPKPAVQIELKISNFTDGVKIKYYAKIISPETDKLLNPVFGSPDPTASNQNDPFVIVVTASDLQVTIKYDHPDWYAVTKIIIEPLFESSLSIQMALLTEQIATITETNIRNSLVYPEKEIIDSTLLENQLRQLACAEIKYKVEKFSYDSEDNIFTSINETPTTNWITSWDLDNGKKIASHDFGFSRTEYGVKVDSDYQIKDIKLLPIIIKNSDTGTETIEATPQYRVEYEGKTAKIVIINDTEYMSWDVFDMEISYITNASGNTSFINRYTKQDTLNYHYSKEFTEPNSSFIFSIGSTENLGLISKIDTTGNLIWERKYEIESNAKPIVFKRIIQLNFEVSATTLGTEGKQYIVYATTGDKQYLLNINSLDGGTIWMKQVLWEDSDILFHIESSKTDAGFFVSISDRNQIDTNKDPFIGKFDEHGNLITGKRVIIPHEEYIINNIYADKQGITLVGRYIEKDSRGVIVRLNNDFSCVESWHITTPYTTIHDVKRINEQRYLISGYSNQSDNIFVALFNGLDNNLMYSFPNTKNHGSLLELDKESFYLLQTTDFEGIINKLDLELNTIWTKEIKLKKGTNGIRNFTFNTLTNKITFNAYNQNQGSVVVHTDKDLQSCLTTILKKPELIRNKCAVESLGINLIDCALTLNDITSIISEINSEKIALCTCECNPKNYTLLHEVCWMSIEDYQYNVNIPSQKAIAADAKATVAGITTHIQPIWRPDTSYYVHFVLKDTVDDRPDNSKEFNFTYGFTTAGPVGYFHTHPKATYGDLELKEGQQLVTDSGTITLPAEINGKILEDANGIIKNPDGTTYSIPSIKPLKITPHPDKYALTSLRQYIDYNRSYPNADGNLLSAKPLFYNDENTHIYLFFNKVYATNFFRDWPEYKNKGGQKGMLKIVIKDPVEKTDNSNPHYPPYNHDDTEYVSIPETEESWEFDDNPQVPFVLNQFKAMLNAPNCIGEATILKPKSEYIKVTPKHLKPNKLYTAIVNNLYDGMKNPTNNQPSTETREVHKFVFKTSRYENFKQQVESYLIKQTIDGQEVQKEAIFKIEQPFTLDQINGAYNTIVKQPINGFTLDIRNNLNNNYIHPYDRIFEGVLALSPLDKAISTEFNIVKNSLTNEIIAIIIRNPEPFNNPKMPIEHADKTIQILSGTDVNEEYSVLLSKDFSQAIIMRNNNNRVIPPGNIKIQFRYTPVNNTAAEAIIVVEIAI